MSLIDDVSNVLNYIVDIFIVLSLAGCLVTIVTYIAFQQMRTQPIKLVIFLCLSIFFAQLFFFLTFYLYDSIMCIPCAMVFHYFFLADFIWTFCVAFNFYQMIVRRNMHAESLEYIYHIAAWTIPMLIVAVMAATGNYYNRGGYCYMAPNTPIFIGFFVPGLIIVTCNTIIFIFTVKEIHETLASAPVSDNQVKSREAKVYFSIFASIGLSWLFGFLMTLVDGLDVLQLVFLILFSIMTPLQGFFIFVSYCCNERVIKQWALVFGIQLESHTSTTSTTASRHTNSSHSTHSHSTTHSTHSHTIHSQSTTPLRNLASSVDSSYAV